MPRNGFRNMMSWRLIYSAFLCQSEWLQEMRPTTPACTPHTVFRLQRDYIHLIKRLVAFCCGNALRWHLWSSADQKIRIAPVPVLFLLLGIVVSITTCARDFSERRCLLQKSRCAASKACLFCGGSGRNLSKNMTGVQVPMTGIVGRWPRLPLQHGLRRHES